MSIDAVFDAFPQLETDRLSLRQIRSDDAADFRAIFSDPEVMKYYDCEPIEDLSAAEQMIERLAERFRARTGIRWGIVLRDAGRLIGTCGYNSVITTQFRAEVGYDLNRRYWGHGIMAEALRAMCAFGFDKMKLHKIEAKVMPGNDATDRLLSKLGFREEGVLRGHGFWKGSFHDLRVFGLLAGELT